MQEFVSFLIKYRKNIFRRPRIYFAIPIIIIFLFSLLFVAFISEYLWDKAVNVWGADVDTFIIIALNSVKTNPTTYIWLIAGLLLITLLVLFLRVYFETKKGSKREQGQTKVKPTQEQLRDAAKCEREHHRLLESLSEVRTKAEELTKLNANTDITDTSSIGYQAITLASDSYMTLIGRLRREERNVQRGKYRDRIELLIKRLLRGRELLERCMRTKTLSGSKDKLDENSRVVIRNITSIIIDWKGMMPNHKEQERTIVRDVGEIVASRLITVENYDYQFITHKNAPEYKEGSITIRLNPAIYATPGVAVKDIQLVLRGKPYDTSWEPMEETISGDIGHYVYAHLEKSFKPGKYQAYIIAIIEGKGHPSPPFTINFPKSTFDKEGY